MSAPSLVWKGINAFYGLQAIAIPTNITEQLEGPGFDEGEVIEATPLGPSSIHGIHTEGVPNDVVSDFIMGTTTHSIVEQLTFAQTVESLYQRVRNQGGVVMSMPMTQVVQASLIRSPYNQKVIDAITVAQTITKARGRDEEVGITVGQTITIAKDSVRHVTDTLPMTQFVNAYLANYHWINPGIATPSSSASMTLEWTTFSVTLRNPKFGDKDTYEATRVNRNTRGGDLQIYRDPMWPTQEILSVEFEYLSAAQAADLLDFMHQSLGHLITLTDQYSRTWTGYIITPDTEVVQTKRIGYSARFDFQGTLS